MKLFCLPYAGGSASSYLNWKNYISEKIDIIPIQLAGRGERFGDSPYSDFQEMADECYTSICNKIDENDYAIYGHSMGSWITYEICRRIYASSLKKPKHVFFSGNRPPYYNKADKRIHNLPKRDFVNEILKLGGGKREILEDPNFGDIFVSILKNDYKLIEEYVCPKDKLIMECDVTILNGIKDDYEYKELLAWSSCTTRKFDIQLFKGGHFFLVDDVEEVTHLLERKLLGRSVDNGNEKYINSI